LTSREEIHRSQGEVAGDAEGAKMLSDFLRSFIRVGLHHLLNGRESLVEHVHVVLCEDTYSKLAVNESISVKMLDLSNE